MNTHADVFSYAGDGIFTITEEDLREVLKAVHVAKVVEYGRLDKMMEFKEAMWDNKYQLSQDESGNWVSTAEEVYTSAKDGSRKSHTVYTWREIQAPNVPAALAVTTTKSSHLDENDIVVVEDVQEGESGWVEHIPMYYLAPEGVFNPSRPDPTQGNLCVLGRDNGCKANAKPAYEKIVLHVPAGTAK